MKKKEKEEEEKKKKKKKKKKKQASKQASKHRKATRIRTRTSIRQSFSVDTSNPPYPTSRRGLDLQYTNPVSPPSRGRHERRLSRRVRARVQQHLSINANKTCDNGRIDV